MDAFVIKTKEGYMGYRWKLNGKLSEAVCFRSRQRAEEELVGENERVVEVKIERVAK